MPELSALTGREHRILRTNYVPVDDKTHFGFVRKPYVSQISLERIRTAENEDPHASTLGGFRMGNIHVKRLRLREHSHMPPARFLNSITLSNIAHSATPEPIGIIYEGNWANVLMGETNGYFLSQQIEGHTLFNVIEELNDQQQDQIFRRMGCGLDVWRREGIYLLDFAPRDIMLYGSNLQPLFVDTENVTRNSDGRGPQNPSLLHVQKSQFRADYRGFLGGRLNHAIERVFHHDSL